MTFLLTRTNFDFKIHFLPASFMLPSPFWRSRRISRQQNFSSLVKAFSQGKLSHYSTHLNWLGNLFDQIGCSCLPSNTPPLLLCKIHTQAQPALIPFRQHSNPISKECLWVFYQWYFTSWDLYFTNGLLKCLVPRATKELTWICIFVRIIPNPQVHCHSHSPN